MVDECLTTEFMKKASIVSYFQLRRKLLKLLEGNNSKHPRAYDALNGRDIFRLTVCPHEQKTLSWR